ncbi:hypothetical protein [Serratia marcescens]|uniref:hypothetical protein n=1 Tax=Serratia marcescens TaxID=615 RepID=UPI000D9D874D|nr:hypothetical protein [Serratia marcescens]PYA49954.1 hypothetical protein DMW45_06560 [Serratia marcescens]
MKRIGLLIVALAAFNATASSPHAWAESERAMRAACLKASGLKNARVEGAIVHYGDDVGYSALFIGGRYPPPVIKNKPGRELCLYQRATQKAAVQAVEGE